MNRGVWKIVLVLICGFGILMSIHGDLLAAGPGTATSQTFPRGLDSYGDSEKDGIWAILVDRAQQEPFNIFATLIFFMAIVHTFLTGKFMVISHKCDAMCLQELEIFWQLLLI